MLILCLLMAFVFDVVLVGDVVDVADCLMMFVFFVVVVDVNCVSVVVDVVR